MNKRDYLATFATSLLCFLMVLSVAAPASERFQTTFAEPQNGFSLALGLDPNIGSKDGPVLVATIKNATDATLILWKVEDPRDLVMTLSRNGVVIPQNQKTLILGGLGPAKHRLPPGGTRELRYALKYFYDLTPGSYEIKATFHLRDLHGNEIALPQSSALNFSL